MWTAHAATITSNNVTGNWNAPGTWVGGVVPGAGDDVVINASATITVTANTSCLSISWTGNPTATRTLTINAGITLNVTGNITLGTTTTNNRNRTLNVLGTLICGGSFTMEASGQDTRDIILSIGTAGQVTITGNLIMASTFARHHIDMTGNARINIGGNVGANAAGSAAGGGFTNPPAGSTINLNGTLPQNYWTNNDPTYAGTFKINNAAGVTFRKAINLGASTLTIGDLTANSLLKDSGFAITCSGTLNLNNGSTLRLGRVGGTGGTATQFPAFATRNIAPGTTVHYAHANAAQTISTAPQYANLRLSTNTQNKTIAAGTLTVRQDLTIEANTTFNGTNNPTVIIGGNFSNSGTLNSGTGLYTFNGTSDQEITSTTTLTFNGGLTINNSGGAIVRNINAAIAIPSGDVFTITNGAIFYAGNNVVNGAGTFTLASGGTLGIGSAGGIAASGSATGNVQTTTRNYNTGANYIYNGTVNQTEGTGLPATVNSLTINNTGTVGNNRVTMVSNVAVTTNLSVLSGILDLATFTANRASAGGTLTLSNGTGLEIGGANTLPSNYNTHVIGATSTVTYKGTTNTVAALNSSQSYGNLVVSASGAVTPNSFGVAGALTVTGSLIASAGTVTMNTVNASITNSGTLVFRGLTISTTPTAQTQYNTSFSVGGTFTIPGGVTFAPPGGTITMNGAASSIANSGTLTFNNLAVTATPTAQSQYNTGFSVGGAFTVSGGVTFAPTGGTITMSAAASSIANSGTLTFNNLTISTTPTAQSQYNTSFSVGGALTVPGGVTFAPTGGTITMSGVASSIVNSGTLTFNNLAITATPTAQSQYNTSFSVGGALTVSGGVTFAPTGGTTTMSAAASSIANSGTLTFNNLTISTTPTAQSQYNTSFSVGGAFTIPGGVTFSPTGGTITMSAASSSIINGGTLAFNNLSIGTTPTAQSQYNTSFSVGGAFTVSGGVTFAPPGGTITLSGNSASVNNSGTLTFNNLTVSGSNVTSTGNFAVNNTMQVSGTFNPAATTVVSGSGTLNGSGTVNVTRIAASPSFAGQYTITNNTLDNLTVNYTGAGAQTVSAANYGNLVISPNGTRTVTLVNGGTIRVSNTFTATTTNTTYVVTGNIFEYNGTGAQTITAFTYNDLIISNNGAKTILAGTTVNCKSITMNDDAVLTLPTTSVLNAELF